MKLEERMLQRIQLQEGSIVLPADISELGSPAQVSRAVKVLLDRGEQVRIGTGIYAKMRRSSTTGAVIPADSLETLATEALERLSGTQSSVQPPKKSVRTWLPIVRQLLAPSRFDVGVVRRAQHGHEHLGAADFPGAAIGHIDGLAGVVDEQPLAWGVGLPASTSSIARASDGSARRTRCTGSRPAARPCTPATAVPASRPCGAVPCARSATPAPAAAPTTAHWAGTAAAPGPRRRNRRAMATSVRPAWRGPRSRRRWRERR